MRLITNDCAEGLCLASSAAVEVRATTPLSPEGLQTLSPLADTYHGAREAIIFTALARVNQPEVLDSVFRTNTLVPGRIAAIAACRLSKSGL